MCANLHLLGADLSIVPVPTRAVPKSPQQQRSSKVILYLRSVTVDGYLPTDTCVCGGSVLVLGYMTCVDQCIKQYVGEHNQPRKCLPFGASASCWGVWRKCGQRTLGVGATVFSGEEHYPRRSCWIPADGPDGVGSASIGLGGINFRMIATKRRR